MKKSNKLSYKNAKRLLGIPEEGSGAKLRQSKDFSDIKKNLED